MLAKGLMAWHCQRPNNSYNENKLFDKHFETLFRPDYPPADILALSRWARCIQGLWTEGTLGLHEALMATPAYSQYHLLYAIEASFAAASNQLDLVPAPSATEHVLGHPESIVKMAANGFNSAFEAAVSEYADRGRIFSPQNWLKANDSYLKVQSAVRMAVGMMGNFAGGREMKDALMVPPDKFMLRWTAD
jgi:hypothetical protein